MGSTDTSLSNCSRRSEETHGRPAIIIIGESAEVDGKVSLCTILVRTRLSVSSVHPSVLFWCFISVPFYLFLSCIVWSFRRFSRSFCLYSCTCQTIPVTGDRWPTSSCNFMRCTQVVRPPVVEYRNAIANWEFWLSSIYKFLKNSPLLY